MTTGTVRRLTPADTDQVLALASFDGLSPSRLAAELAAEDDYWWVGLATSTGRLCAVHRSMRWGRHLLLKGVLVDGSSRGSGAVLQLAFALRDAARRQGYAGVAAWVEPHEPEAALARMLRLRQTGPLVHLFEVPIPVDEGGARAPGPALAVGSPDNRGTIVVRTTGQLPMVANLLGPVDPAGEPTAATAADEVTAYWVVDGRRLVLSACPCADVTQVAELVAMIGPTARERGATALEIPLPAVDVLAALYLAGTGVRRLSRTPARLGRLDFAVVPPDERLSTNGTTALTHRGSNGREQSPAGRS